MCGKQRRKRMDRHTGGFSIGNQNKQQIVEIKCKAGHCVLNWQVEILLNGNNNKKLYLNL